MRKKPVETKNVLSNTPAAIESEKICIKALLNGNLSVYQLEPDLFFNEIAVSIVSLVKDAVVSDRFFDSPSILDKLGNTEEQVNFFKSLPENIENVDITEHLAILKEKKKARELLQKLSSTLLNVIDTSKSDAALPLVSELKTFLSEEDAKIVSSQAALIELHNQVAKNAQNSKKYTGVPIGIEKLDTMTLGFQPSEVILIAARSSFGKSALMVTAIANIIQFQPELAVVLFELEMSRNELIMRLISAIGNIDLQYIRSGKMTDYEWARYFYASSIIEKAKLIIDDTASTTVGQIRQRLLTYEQFFNQKIDICFIDYLQLITPEKREDRVHEVSMISRHIKLLAKDLSIPIVALSQLSRSPDKRLDHRPVLSDLRECVTADTMVLTSNGVPKAIVDLKEGDYVKSLDTDTLKIVDSKVSSVWNSGVKKVYEVRTNTGNTIKCSINHPFLTINGWKPLEDLKVGDCIASSKIGNVSQHELVLEWEELKSIEYLREEETYDISVENTHNFIANNLVVHNSGDLENNADVVIFIYREEMYNPTTENKGLAELIVAKQRNGPTGSVMTCFSARNAKFLNVVVGE